MEKIKIKTISITIFTSIVFVLFVSSVLFVPACKNSNGESIEKTIKEESSYLEATVESRDISSKINLFGIALAEIDNSLYFEISGELLFIAEQGDMIIEGETLAEINDDMILQELEILQSSIEDARDFYEYELLKHHSTYANIEIEIELAEYYYYNETEGRKPDRLIFEQQLLTLEEQKAAADFELNQKEDVLNDLQEEYENRLQELANKLEIIAPFDCLVTSVSASEGNKINSDQQVIDVIDYNSMIIRADLPEIDKNKVAENMEANIYFNAYPDNLLRGNLFRIGRIPVNTNAGTFYEIFIEFKELQGIEMEDVYGLNAEVEILTSGGDNILVVPVDYLYSEGSEKYVYKITSQRKIEKTYVETGVSDLSYIEIVSGLEEGDRIVINK